LPFTAALVSALFLVPCAAAAAADELPSAAEIRQKIAAATDPFPESFREVDETVSSDGMTTIERDYRRGRDFRFTFDRGPFHTERGVNNRVAWHMNDNGQVVIDQPDPGQASPEALTTTVAVVHTPVEGYVIARLNVRGNGIKDYVDVSAWRIVRRESISSNGTTVTTWDDVREDHGRTFAHHVHVEDGNAQVTSDQRVTAFLPDDVDPKSVEIPKPLRALVSFPEGVTSVDLPAKFGRSHVYVRVMIGARGLDFVLDTGASGITLDSTVARELGLAEYGKRSAVTAGRYTTARTIVPEMKIGNLVMRNVAVQEVPQGWETAEGVKEVGLMGFDFLAELGVTIDYEHERVTVVPAANYEPPTDGNVIPIDVRIGSGQPRTNVILNGALGERWIIDTGGAGTFLIFDYFARRHPEALKDVGRDTTGRNRSLYGIGGPIQAQAYQIASVQLGKVNFKDFVGYRVTGNSYATNLDGLIGSDFLHFFTLGLDYVNSRIYLVPNRQGRAAMGL
jgi:predicted aspartyl protease